MSTGNLEALQLIMAVACDDDDLCDYYQKLSALALVRDLYKDLVAYYPFERRARISQLESDLRRDCIACESEMASRANSYLRRGLIDHDDVPF